MADYVTFTTAGQLFGLPIENVQDVFTLANITRIPLAGREVAGVLNLRGRIVTVIDLANRLQLDAPSDVKAHMVIGIERGSESFGILVDRVGEVLTLADGDREPAPINLDRVLAAMATGVFRLDEKILVALDADRTLNIASSRSSATE
ncbi:MAG TPA: chemotaxis protein CheW [Xanthobacteraceae bacterium]|jgi:purine-binding chemotaxis protein CheW|nr:chemotaxis protein CheW [Xanthobacteraceae bacterium]